MSKSIAVVVPACILTLCLAACASPGATRPTRTVATSAPAAVTAGNSKTLADVPYGFQLVVQKGEEYYCKRELITGSRTNSRDVCLTKAQMEAQIQGTRDFLKRNEDAATRVEARGSPGGTYNSAITR
ncbi:MAG: hypothetical protein U1F39_03325 [Steroidobacteraceae bacterium]